jgi:hypothetical protein
MGTRWRAGGPFTDMSNQQRSMRNGMREPHALTAATNLSSIWDVNPSQQFVGTYRESG